MDVKVFTEDGALELAEKLLQNDKDIKEELEQKGYATESFVTEKIAEAQLSGGEVDLSGYVSKEDLDDYAKTSDIPTTLPASDVYDWAKAETKPEYTADEVGALPSNTEIPSIEGLVSEKRLTEVLSLYAKTTDIVEYDDTELIDKINDTQIELEKKTNKTDFDELSSNVVYIEKSNDVFGAVDTVLTTQNIVDNVDSSLSNMVLSAKQGKMLNERISNIIAHNNETDGNTELLDIRVDADGTTHSSAGDAIRNQINMINSEIADVEEIIKSGAIKKYESVNDYTKYEESLFNSSWKVNSSSTTTKNYVMIYTPNKEETLRVTGAYRIELFANIPSDTVEGDYIERLYQAENATDIFTTEVTVKKGQTIGLVGRYETINPVIIESVIYTLENDTANFITKISDTQYSISVGKYRINFEQKTTSGYTRWNVLGVDYESTNLVTNSTDILGVIRESNGTFLGGVHGREQLDSMAIFADGVMFNGLLGESVRFNKLDIFQESKIHSSIDDVACLKRFLRISFENNTMTVENNFTCIVENGFVTSRCTNGGIFGSPNDIVTAIALTNKFYGNPPIADTSISEEVQATLSTYFYNSGNSITMENIIGKEQDSYSGLFTIYGNENPIRTKIYFNTIEGENRTIANNETIFGKFKYTFN